MENEKNLYDDLREYFDDFKYAPEKSIIRMLAYVLNKHGIERIKIDQVIAEYNLLVESDKRKDVEYILRKNRRNY